VVIAKVLNVASNI